MGQDPGLTEKDDKAREDQCSLPSGSELQIRSDQLLLSMGRDMVHVLKTLTLTPRNLPNNDVLRENYPTRVGLGCCYLLRLGLMGGGTEMQGKLSLCQ